MASPISRSDVFKNYPNLASEIARIQKESYDPDELEFFEKEAEKRDYKTAFDALLLPQRIGNCFYKVVCPHYSDAKTYDGEFPSRLLSLLDIAGIKPSILTADHKMNIESIIGEVDKNSMSDLPDREAMRISDRSEFENAARLVFHFVKHNSSPEYLFFADSRDRIAFFICRYGNLHTVEFGKELLTPECLSNAGWFEVTTRCYVKN